MIRNMIKILDQGCYQLYKATNESKLLTIDKKKNYIWNKQADKEDITLCAYKNSKKDELLTVGKYRLYAVKNENDLSDGEHLELFVGDGKWQGYLLPTSLPSDKKLTSPIYPTEEIITIVSM